MNTTGSLLTPPAPAQLAALKEALGQSPDAAKAVYEQLIGSHAPTAAASLADRTLASELKPSFRAAQFEVLENRIRAKIELPLSWSQPLNQQVFEAFERAGIPRDLLSAHFVGQVVKYNLLPLMGSSISSFFRARNGELEGQLIDPTGRRWKPIPSRWQAGAWRITAAGIALWNRDGQSPLMNAYPLQEGAALPELLTKTAHKASYIGIWSLDTPRATTDFGHLHHGIVCVEKNADCTQPILDLGGFVPNVNRDPGFDVLDNAYTSLIDGRRTASAQLFQIGSLDQLHKLYALLQQPPSLEIPPELNFLWSFPRHRRFPALVHALITRSAPRARRLLESLKAAASKIELPEESPLTARSVLSLAIELSEKAYPHFDGKAVNCRFLAKRVMRVAEALLDLQPAPETLSGTLSGSSSPVRLGPLHLRPTPRRAWICRVMLWLADLLGWWKDRFGRTLPLPKWLAWKTDFPNRPSPAAPEAPAQPEPPSAAPAAPWPAGPLAPEGTLQRIMQDFQAKKEAREKESARRRAGLPAHLRLWGDRLRQA